MQRPPLTDKDGEVRELTAEDIKLFRPLAEVDPGMTEAMTALRNTGGGPKVEAIRERIGFRWPADLVARIKAGGNNYNARIEKILREAERAGKL